MTFSGQTYHEIRKGNQLNRSTRRWISLMGPRLILSCVTLLNSDQLLYGHVHNVDRLIQHMLEQFLNNSTACLTWQNELTFYISSIVI